MKLKIWIVFYFGATLICNAQTSSVKYYKNQYLIREVEKERAGYSETIIKNADGTVTTEIKNIKKGEVTQRETYKGDEPVGKWIAMSKWNTPAELDYNFDLIYSKPICKDSSIKNFKINDYLKDNDTINYKAPKIYSGEINLNQFIIANIVYPVKAREAGISGKVFLAFTITKEGTVSDLCVIKGSNIVLDKEAMRVFRELKFSNPAKVNGVPQNCCLLMPISFRIK